MADLRIKAAWRVVVSGQEAQFKTGGYETHRQRSDLPATN